MFACSEEAEEETPTEEQEPVVANHGLCFHIYFQRRSFKNIFLIGYMQPTCLSILYFFVKSPHIDQSYVNILEERTMFIGPMVSPNLPVSISHRDGERSRRRKLNLRLRRRRTWIGRTHQKSLLDADALNE